MRISSLSKENQEKELDEAVRAVMGCFSYSPELKMMAPDFDAGKKVLALYIHLATEDGYLTGYTRGLNDGRISK